MDFATAMHMLLLNNTKDVFPTEGFHLDFFNRINQILRDTGCLPSFAVRSVK